MRNTIKAIREKKSREKITALTGYDFPFAKILDTSGIDIILVGDSLGMVMLGYSSTVPVTMREMIHHTKAVTRAVRHALVVGDMPFGSVDDSARALRNAKRFIKEAGADAVKIEGGRSVESQIKTLIRSGIPVMGHLGMTPQTASQLGGYKVQGRDRKQAAEIMKDALLLDRLGVFAMVLECVPAKLAAAITRKVKCPTIGIGAGPSTDGQILVLHDMLGFETGIHAKFMRRYAELGEQVSRAVRRYHEDVIHGKFPTKEESY